MAHTCEICNCQSISERQCVQYVQVHNKILTLAMHMLILSDHI